MGVVLITVHGMGLTEENYANDLLAKLFARMGPRYAEVDPHVVYYAKLLQDNEDDVWTNVSTKAKVRFDHLRRFLLFGFGDAAGLENRKELDASVYEQAQLIIANKLLDAYRSHATKRPVVLMSHSLGCHVLSSYLYDAQKFRDGGQVSAGIWKSGNPFIAGLTSDERSYLRGDSIMGWITTGCNIPVFVAAHKKAHVIPIKKPNEYFRWLNLYDPDDVLGWPLQPLSDSYGALVEDVAINAGHGVKNCLIGSWNPLSHLQYWTDDDVIKPLAAMLTKLVN